MRVVPDGFSTSTRVVTSKVRQAPDSAALCANKRPVRVRASDAEATPIVAKKSRRFIGLRFSSPLT